MPRYDRMEVDRAYQSASPFEMHATCAVFTADTFFVGDEMYFGNDRLAFVRESLRRAA